MKLKGNMVIELVDGNTGEEERIEEVQTAGGARFTNVATPLFQYQEFLFGWGGNYGSDYRMAYLAMPYLASINNLGSAVVKNTDKTMKITYTLTEEP